MARIRSIKPEFWTDPDVASCSMAARLLFIGCWNHADDYGVLKDDPDRLRLQILPDDDVDAFGLIDELVKRRLLERMIAPDGTKVLVVRTFCVHQKIDKRSTGRYGLPDDFQPAPPDPHQSPPIPPEPDRPQPYEGTGGEGTGGDFSTPLSSNTTDPGSELELVSSSPAATDPVQTVFNAWRESTGKHKALLDHKRRKVIVAALKTYPVDELVDAVTGWRCDPHCRGENDRHTVYNNLDLLLRDASHIEKFRDLARGDPTEHAAYVEPRSWQAISILQGRT